MSASLYTEKFIQPDDTMLAYDLGNAKQLLDSLASFIETQYGDFKTEWKFYNQKSGWILKMFTKKRNVLFIIPKEKYFRVVLTFGEKATDAILASNFPEPIKQLLLDANKYAEGRTIQFNITSSIELEWTIELIKLKLSF